MKEQDLFDLWSDTPNVEYTLDNMTAKGEDVFKKIKDNLVYEAIMNVLTFLAYIFLLDKSIGLMVACMHLVICIIWAFISHDFYKKYKSINELSIVQSMTVKANLLRNYISHLKINMLIGVPIMTFLILAHNTKSDVPFVEALLGDENYYILKIWGIFTVIGYLSCNWVINMQYKVHLKSLKALCKMLAA